MTAKLTCGCFVFAGLALAGERGEEIKLWPNGAPGSEGVTAAEVSKPSTNPKYVGLPASFTVTHYPSLYVFLPPKEKATGAAMVVAPGGGHTQLVIEKEGWEIADWLNANGIAAFVLKYRLARAPGSKYTLPEQVYADAARAMRLNYVPDETADALAFIIRNEVGDVVEAHESRGLLDPQAHRVVGHAHHRLRHAQGRFPLVAFLHLAPRHAGEGDLRAARKAFDAMRHD